MKPAATISFLLALTSCELVTQIDIPEPPRVAVVNSVFASDTTWFVNIQTSAHILSEFGYPVTDLQVSLTDDTGQQIPLTQFDAYDPLPQFWGQAPRGSFFRGDTKPQPGMLYHIEVSGSNIPTAYANARAPVLVDIIDLKIDSTNAIIGPGESYRAIPIEFTFDDPGGVADYYYPRMYAFYEGGYSVINGDTTKYKNTGYIGLVKELPNDTEFSINGDEVDAISDEPFEGKRHTVQLYIIDYSDFGGPSGPEPYSVRFYLGHANEDYFKYMRSLRLHENARDNPFAEPVQVFSNIEGGLGIFAGLTTTYREFK